MKVAFTEMPQAILAVAGHVRDLVDEARFTFKEGLLRVAVVDPAHVAMKVVEMPLECGATPEVTFLVDLDDLKALGRLNQAEAATFTFEQSNAEHHRDTLVVQQGGIVVTIKLQAVENSQELKWPNLRMATQFHTKASAWAQAIAMCGDVDDHLALDVNSAGRVQVTAGGETTTKVEIVLQANPVTTAGRALFSCDYLHNAAKALLGADGRRDTDLDLLVRFSADAPIEVTAQAGFCKVQFVMAPRIESS